MNPYTIPISRSVKQILLMLSDSVLLVLSLALSLALLGHDFFAHDVPFYFYLALANIATILLFIKLGLYRAIVLYMGLQSALILLQGVTAATLLVAGVFLLTDTQMSSGYSVLGSEH